MQLFKKYTQSIPYAVKILLVKAFILFVIWKLMYHLWLGPTRIIDKPLTDITTASTVVFVKLFDKQNTIRWQSGIIPADKEFYKANIYLNNKKILGIADPCNALELFVLFAGFLIVFPTNLKRLMFFLINGIVFIFCINVLRCSAMYWLNVTKSIFFDFAHHYLFKIIAYGAIFYSWILYTKSTNNQTPE